MKPKDLIELCDIAIARWSNPDLPKMPGTPKISVLWPVGKPLPTDFVGIPYESHPTRRGTMLWICAHAVKQKMQYAIDEGLTLHHQESNP